MLQEFNDLELGLHEDEICRIGIAVTKITRLMRRQWHSSICPFYLFVFLLYWLFIRKQKRIAIDSSSQNWQRITLKNGAQQVSCRPASVLRGALNKESCKKPSNSIAIFSHGRSRMMAPRTRPFVPPTPCGKLGGQLPRWRSSCIWNCFSRWLISCFWRWWENGGSKGFPLFQQVFVVCLHTEDWLRMHWVKPDETIFQSTSLGTRTNHSI